ITADQLVLLKKFKEDQMNWQS
ncbi:orotate phosphoribosyltransferase, partial [Streptococcus agalactiae]|nr:orotate phosphoribosyltransferase [Streptococcus agalactiae]MCC9944859.1 orotate phosphoribosyltransferase [Streptococcus agalactiae]MCC9961912.1 orotate phosphoribosyltransferase [Streptococcus agalactiae]MCC9971242.1 orotate phosphoribosyltransferase [Streptococcus agalactiae]